MKEEQESQIDWRIARMCYVIAASAGAEKVKVEDFMPSKEVELTPEQSVESALAYVRSVGGKIVEKPSG